MRAAAAEPELKKVRLVIDKEVPPEQGYGTTP
jgi:hypothetical protein